MLSTQSPAPRPSLTSLPIELLTTIAGQLDLISARSFSLVSRAFVQPTEARRYRDLDLFLHPHFGEYPLVQAEAKAPGKPYVKWAQGAAIEAEDRHQLGLKENVKTVLVDTGSRRLGMVKRVTMKPRAKAVDGILLLLDVLSPTLRELHFLAPERQPYDIAWRPYDQDTLDVRSINYGLAFPALTHLRIGQYASRHADYLLLLCAAAPSLVHLEADVRYDQHLEEPYADSAPEYPSLVVDTKIRHLRLSFDDRDDGLDSDDEDEEEREKAKRRLCHPALVLLSRSPSIRRLSIRYAGGASPVRGALVIAICNLPSLQDLHWWGTLGELCYSAPGDTRTFSALRRLAVSSQRPLDFLPEKIFTPMLEAIYVQDWEYSESAFIPPSSEYPEPLPVLTMLPQVARYLQQSPRLTTLHAVPYSDSDIFPLLDKVEAAGHINGSVRSFRHGDLELVHLRRLLHWVEVSDYEYRPVARSRHQPYTAAYAAEDGTHRMKGFEYRREAAWVDTTDFQGLAVPIEVISKMRRVQGASLAQWKGRNVEVDDEAWKVLTDWHARQKAAGAGGE